MEDGGWERGKRRKKREEEGIYKKVSKTLSRYLCSHTTRHDSLLTTHESVYDVSYLQNMEQGAMILTYLSLLGGTQSLKLLSNMIRDGWIGRVSL